MKWNIEIFWKIRPWLMIISFTLATAIPPAPANTPEQAGIQDISLDLSQPGVVASNVVKRSLYFARPKQSINLGPVGIGSFGPGSVRLPFFVGLAGSYRLVLTYALVTSPRHLTISIDGKSPGAGWSEAKLWATSPDYPWGSSHLYHQWPPPVKWAVEGPVTLTSGSHVIGFTFDKGDILLTAASLTTNPLQPNNPKPWFQAGYVPFPALVFSSRQTSLDGDRLRITFTGTWYNLAPDAVTYTLHTAVMPRKGNDTPRFKVVSVSPAMTLHLDKNGTYTFSLSVESDSTVPISYSELVRLDLMSNDVPNVSKPYLMAATNGYLEARTQEPLIFVKGYEDAGWSVAANTDVNNLIPSRDVLGLADGEYQRSLTDAFLYGLATDPQPVVTEKTSSGGLPLFDYTRWANTDASTWPYNNAPYSFDSNNPLGHFLASMGQAKDSLVLLKRAMLRLSDELPFYPVERWDESQPGILPTVQYERTGAVALAAYVRLVQAKALSDDEHFRFLHNVILPLYVAYRDDLRIGGLLAQPVRAGDTQVALQRDTPPFVSPEELTGEWIRIGSDRTTEYIRPGERLGNGVVKLDSLAGGEPFKYDHAAGETWVSLQMNEARELEATDIWSYLVMAVASRDSAIAEQCGDMLTTIFQTQNIFREDGSFGDEPGSYGWGVFEYLREVKQINAFLDPSYFSLSKELRQKFLNALIMWNDFPFSDGIYPMLNEGGATNQLPRLDYALQLLKDLFPDQQDLIARYQTIINQEQNRAAGTTISNRSFKVDGWGYAMLRGPGSWDQRIETLLASKHLLFYPGDHVSNDALGIVLFAHGALMTPRYGYDWRGYPRLLMNTARIDGREDSFWGDFLHFDGDPNMPSAIASSDMAAPRSLLPGVAHQERWLIQLPEYLFDSYSIRPRDGKVHTFQWGYRNLGEVAITLPDKALMRDAKNPDGSLWDPFGYYVEHTEHHGQEFTTDRGWQASWTMKEGNIRFVPPYAYPPFGTQIRVTMEGVPQTRVVIAWLNGPARNDTALLRQDFIVTERSGLATTFTTIFEPVDAGKNSVIRDITTVAQIPADSTRVVRVTTTTGTDWFLVDTSNFKGVHVLRQVGPFVTDAALAVVRVRDGQVHEIMFTGGSNLQFAADRVVVDLTAIGIGPHHYGFGQLF